VFQDVAVYFLQRDTAAEYALRNKSELRGGRVLFRAEKVLVSKKSVWLMFGELILIAVGIEMLV
jgi:hypothetical protein